MNKELNKVINISFPAIEVNGETYVFIAASEYRFMKTDMPCFDQGAHYILKKIDDKDN